MQSFEEFPFKMKEELHIQTFMTEGQTDRQDENNMSVLSPRIRKTYYFNTA